MTAEKTPTKALKICLYGVGVVAPEASSLQEFMAKVAAQTPVLKQEPALSNLFLVGKPQFDFLRYKPWISQRHQPSKFSQLQEKGSQGVQLAVGTTIDALESNPGLEKIIQKIDSRVLVCIGSAFGEIASAFQAQKEFVDADRAWTAFWSQPERNEALAARLATGIPAENEPPHPRDFEPDSQKRWDALYAWHTFWAARSTALQNYVHEMIEIESMGVGTDVANDKLNLIRTKAKAKKNLQERYGSPLPPWEAVTPNILWNIPNAPAAQLTMLLGIHGAAFGTSGACATFGVALHHAIDGIRSGQYDAAIVGTVDATPPPLEVAAFHAAKVLAAGDHGVPMTQMRGTHVSGGACTWILGAADVFDNLQVKSLGVEVLAVGLSSDAEHIITPSAEGPKHAIREALRMAEVKSSDIRSWDMHATGTPGDWSEFHLIQEFVPPAAVVSARKGIFGHGMGTCGGWELTVQTLGIKASGNNCAAIPPSGIPRDQLHPNIKALERRIALDKPEDVDAPDGTVLCGKLSMGIGGITSCVLTRVSLPKERP